MWQLDWRTGVKSDTEGSRTMWRILLCVHGLAALVLGEVEGQRLFTRPSPAPPWSGVSGPTAAPWSPRLQGHCTGAGCRVAHTYTSLSDEITFLLDGG